MKKYVSYFILLVALPLVAKADGWALLSKHNALRDNVIVDTGDISPIPKPYGASWNVDLYQLNNRCLAFSGYSNRNIYGKKAALLLVNSAQKVSVALIESSIGAIKTEIYAVEIYECPFSTSVLPSSSDLAETIRRLEEQQKELRRQLEELSQ